MKTIQTLTTLIMALNINFSAQARDVSLEKARAVKSELVDFLGTMQGVNSVGITRCDAETGAAVSSSAASSVYCVQASVETTRAYNAITALLPEGTKYKGVYLSFKKVGRIEPQPRITSGNSAINN